MAFQTQCCVLLAFIITITAGVPVPVSDVGAVSPSCSPCKFPKNLPKECMYEMVARNPNTGEICPYCINLCPSSTRSSKTALGNSHSKTNSVVSTKSGYAGATNKSKTSRKSKKTKPSKSRRRSSKRKGSNKLSRRSKSKSRSTSGKITSNLRTSYKAIKNRAPTGQRLPSVQLAYGESTPDMVSPLVRSSKSKKSRKGISHLKTSRRNSRRRSKVRSMNVQPLNSFADQPLSWSQSRGRSSLSTSKYRSNKRQGGRNSRRSYNGPPSMSNQNHYQSNYDNGRNTASNGAWNGFYDNGYNVDSHDSRENDRNDDRSDDNDDWSSQGHIGGWDDLHNGDDRSDENNSNNDSFENVSRVGNYQVKSPMYGGGSSSAEDNKRSRSQNNYNRGWNGSDQGSSENRSNSSDDDDK